MIVNDFSFLDPKEANRRYVQLANRILAEQFHKQFFIRDPRPEYYLKYEIHAFLSGTIKEFHGWNDPIGQAKQWIVDQLTSWFRNFWNWTIRPGIQWIMDGFKWIWNSAVSWAREAYNKAIEVYNIIQEVYGYLRWELSQKLEEVWVSLRNIGGTIYTYASRAIQTVRLWIQEGSNWIWNRITNVVLPFIKQHYLLLLGPIGEVLEAVKAFYPQLSRIWSGITERVHGIFETVSRQMAALPQAIASGFQGAIAYLRDILKQLWNEVLVPFGNVIKSAVTGVVDKIGDLIWNLFSGFYNTVLNLAPVNPAVAKENIPMIMKMAMEAAIGLGGAYIVGELLHPLKQIGLGHLAAMIYKASNYDLITGAIIGALATAAFGQPLKYSFNEIFRPYLLSWSQVMELHSRNFLEDQEFMMFLKYHGYPDEFKKYFDELANTPVRYFGLAAVARMGYFDEQFFMDELNRSGYSQQAKQVMLQMYAQTAKEAVKAHYASVVIDRYRAGIIDKSGLDQELKMLGYPDKVRPSLITGAQLYYDLDSVKDHIEAIRFAYRRGKITIEQLKAELANLGIRDDMISRIAAVELARTKTDVGSTEQEEVRAYGRGTAVKRYKAGLITDVELENELRMMGYTQQWIERLKLVARLERDYDFAMEVLRTMRTAYKKGNVDDAEFIETLKNFGFTNDKIQLELSLLKLQSSYGVKEEQQAG